MEKIGARLITADHKQNTVQERLWVRDTREEYYRQLLDNQLDPICSLLADNTVIFANQAFCRFAGRPAEELEGQRLFDIESLPIQSDQIHRLIDKVTLENPIQRKKTRFMSSGGEFVCVEWTAQGLFDNQNERKEIHIVGHDITELISSQDQLKDSQANFMKLAHAAPALIYIYLPEEDRLGYANARYGEFTGYAPEECVAMNCWDMIHPDSERMLREDTHFLLQHQDHTIRHEGKILTRDGRELWQDLSKTYINFGGKSAILGIAYDITEHKKAQEMVLQQNQELHAGYSQLEAMNEEIIASQDALLTLNQKLKDSQERLELALWGSDEGLWDWDMVSGELIINDRITHMLYYEPDALKKHVDTWAILVHPEDAMEVGKNLKQHLQRKTPCYDVEYRLKGSNGQWVWVYDRGKAVEWNEAGRATRIVGMRMDITRQKEAQKAIEEAKNKYATLIAAIPELVIQVGRDYKYVWVNDVAREFFGEQILGSRADEYFIKPEELSLMNEGLQKLYKGHIEKLEIETWQRRRDGESRVLHWMVKPLEQEGIIIGNLATARDVTDIHKAEERIRYLSFHDSLTGLYNRAYVNEEIHRIDTPGQYPLSIIMGDVNALKLTNDAFGHFEGDKLLKTIADILLKVCRSEDIVTRWGGDEFLILLPRTSQKQAYRICERIQEACRNCPADPIQPSIALGASCKENEEQDLIAVRAEAEDSMYRNKLLEGSSLRNSIIVSLEGSLNERTHETHEHATRMQEIATAFARAMELPSNEIDRLILLAKLHDIGKLGIPDSILTKPSALNEEEWEIIKKHPEIGFRITQTAHNLIGISEEILSHHERWDGTGYPRGLKGEDIPLLARIISIVDSYDVMMQGRPYRLGVSPAEALAEIRRCSGSQFDPSLVDLFLSAF